MRLFGSGIIFYGGPGESAHKQFMKIPGQRTQCRVSEFAQQTALQYYNMLVSGFAAGACLIERNNLKQSGGNRTTRLDKSLQAGDISIQLLGKYDFIVTHDLIERMRSERKVDVIWKHDDDKKSKATVAKHNLSSNLVKVSHRILHSSIGTTVTGFTMAVFTSTTGECTQFYAHPCFQGQRWYDWALIHFEESNNHGELIKTHYPSRVLGFILIDGKQEAVIQCLVKPILWMTVEKHFIVPVKLGTDFNISFVTVPMDALVHPLCVLPDLGGETDAFFIVLPKRNWSRYFGDRIEIK